MGDCNEPAKTIWAQWDPDLDDYTDVFRCARIVKDLAAFDISKLGLQKMGPQKMTGGGLCCETPSELKNDKTNRNHQNLELLSISSDTDSHAGRSGCVLCRQPPLAVRRHLPETRDRRAATGNLAGRAAV